MKHSTANEWMRRCAAALLLCGLTGPVVAWEEYVAVHAGKVIIGNGEEKDNVTILILDGKIEAIGENVELPFPCREIEARGWTVMPGLIHPHSRIGLLSYNRSGSQANLRVLDEFLPDPADFEEALEAGFTTVALAPPGNSGLTGKALLVRTADVGAGLVLQDESYVKVNLQRPGTDRRLVTDALKKAKEAIDKREKARQEWEDKKKKAEEEAKKKAEAEKKKQEEEKKNPGSRSDPEPKPSPEPQPENGKKEEKAAEEEFKPPAIPENLQPFVDLIEKKEGTFALVEMGGASTYLHLREAIKGFEVPYVLKAPNNEPVSSWQVGTDLNLVATELGKNKEVVVTTANLNRAPYTIDRINLPQALTSAGATVAFVAQDDRAESLAALRFETGEVVKGGMARAAALQALTLNVARALGQESRLGSIEVGKDANLLLLSGDALDVQSRVEKVMIEGVVAYERKAE